MQVHTVHYISPGAPIRPPLVQTDCDGHEAFDSRVVTGDALKVLSELPSNCIQAVVTSPPYWGLRDYCIKGQIGLEQDVDDYIEALVTVFEQVRRVLRPDGSLWLNIGDSYTSGGRTWRAPDKKNPARAMSTRPPTPKGLKSKELAGIPWRLASTLQHAGWYLRSDVIWRKPNAQPESVKDRPTRSHEYLFFLTKSERYYYNNMAVREVNDRNVRSVWDINTYPLPNVHFATFPPKLVEPCLKLSTRPGDIVMDPFFGSGTVGVVAIELARPFLGIELNPDYVDTARRRIQQLARLDRPVYEVEVVQATEIHERTDEEPLRTAG
ncbi:MAG: site-specific DNA-methyltransferase [Chloroflexota bacterium]|nr:site-specific DNA-methyltransferase [Chloroflexota bacterium]MDQ5867942.1 site-specific DNA-methyltransferase [Chloroflexota bacterium]